MYAFKAIVIFSMLILVIAHKNKTNSTQKIKLNIGDKNSLFKLPLEYLKKKQELKEQLEEFVDETIHSLENSIGKHIIHGLENFINW